MKVIVEDSANKSMDSIYYYNMRYSFKNALETDNHIRLNINNLANFPYTGKYIPEIIQKEDIYDLLLLPDEIKQKFINDMNKY